MNCKLTWKQLKQMGDNALWAEKMYLELGMHDEAHRYAMIWNRIFKAMVNPVFYFER